MSRLPRDTRIETREARKRLPSRKEPYWRSIHQGLAIGYYRGKKSGVWFMRRQVDGRYQKTRIGIVDDHADADGVSVLDYKQAYAKVLDKAEQKTPLNCQTVNDAADSYLEWFEHHRKSHYSTSRSIKKHIRPRLGKTRLDALTTRQIKNWHHRLAKIESDDPEAIRRRKCTANRVLSILKALLNAAWADGDVTSDEAWRRVKPFRGVEVSKTRFLSQDECGRLLNACEADFQVLVKAALLTGCRYGELIRLRATDYLCETGVIFVAVSKSGNPRYVPLTDEGQLFFTQLTTGKPNDELIFVRADGTPWGRAHQARRMHDACAAADITPPASFHHLRHTYGSFLARANVSLQVIAAALGHADTRITEKHYAHLQPDYITETIRKHLPRLGMNENNVAQLRRVG